jgi:SAM-dependent methyltransferase
MTSKVLLSLCSGMYKNLGKIEKKFVPRKYRISKSKSPFLSQANTDDSGYEPVSVIKLSYATFKLLQHSNRHRTTYDIGCGKGFLIYLLWKFRFQNIIGLELNQKLYDESKRNLKKIISADCIEIYKVNAASFAFEPNSNVFCFNPFTGETFKQFFNNLMKSSQSTYFVYINDLEHEFLEDKAIKLSRNTFLRVSIWYIAPSE